MSSGPRAVRTSETAARRRSRRTALAPGVAVLAVTALACGGDAGVPMPRAVAEIPTASSAASTAEARTDPAPFLVETAEDHGVRFVHDNGARGDYLYPELLGPGLALLDFDDDGWLDLFLVQGGPLGAGDPAADGPTDRLYRNQRDGTFADVTERAGVGDGRYGFGAAVADYDRDGLVDLYVTNLGRNSLFRNLGGGRFEDVTERSAVGGSAWSIGATFLDHDRDGDLDLFVADYVEWSLESDKPCYGRAGLRGYCHPLEYPPARATLYRQERDHRFTDQSVASGIASRPGNGMGVAAADFDGDGWIDLYVANDQMPNHLWMNDGDGTFREEAVIRGSAVDGRGAPEASMGIALGDPDRDGDWDLFVSHLAGETNTFYENLGDGTFLDVTERRRLGAPSLPVTGFGAAFLDHDHDGLLDLLVANGKVRRGDRMTEDYREPAQLFRQAPGGAFEERAIATGAVEPWVGRGAAIGDLDNDGDLDVVVAENGGPVRLLRNLHPARGDFLVVDLVGRGSGRIPIGAVAIATIDGQEHWRLVQPASGYATSNDPRLHFGLGSAQRVERLEIRWPGGRTSELTDVAGGRILVVEEPERLPDDGAREP